MKRILFVAKFGLFAIFATGLAHSNEPVFEVHDRNRRGHLVDQSVELSNLTSQNSFEGKHFRILHKDTQAAVQFSDPSDRVKKAATVYYHLEKAKAAFEKLEAKVPAVAALGANVKYPVSIRIEMDLPYSDVSHFVKDGSKQYNNSLTIPASDSMKATEVSDWGTEIWFYQAKNEKVPSFVQQLTGILNQSTFKRAILQQLTYPEITKLAVEISYGISPQWTNHLVSLGTSLLITDVMLPFLSFLSKPLKASQRIDTAIIPEVVYHEFAHLLFEGQLGLFKPTGIVEGFPNYFAYQVSGLNRLAAKTKKAAKGYLPKNGKSKALYSFDQDRSLMAATGSFVFSLLYQLEQAFGENEANQIIYGALMYLDRSSAIQLDFEKAIFQSIQDHSQVPMVQTLRAHQVFQARGL